MSHDPIFTAGRVAVITGAASGIGLAAAKRCASAGMKVVMTDISDGLDAAAAQVAAISGVVEHHALDVTDFAAVQALAEDVFARHGEVALLMNNAGRGFASKPFGEYDAWRRTMDVNLWGVVHGVQAFTQAMLDQGRPGRIVNTGSKQGITNPPGDLAYNVSKSAVKTLTEGLQHALRNVEAGQVTAHLLIPGFTYTGLIQARIPQKPASAWTSEQVWRRATSTSSARTTRPRSRWTRGGSAGAPRIWWPTVRRCRAGIPTSQRRSRTG